MYGLVSYIATIKFAEHAQNIRIASYILIIIIKLARYIIINCFLVQKPMAWEQPVLSAS